MINSLECIFGIEGHEALDRNLGPGYKYHTLAIDTRSLNLRACPHRQFYTLPRLYDGRAALPNPYPNECTIVMMRKR